MMSSSPPPNQNAEFNQSNTNNLAQTQPHLLSSPTFRESLNLQLDGIESNVQLHMGENSNYTTNDIQVVNQDSGSSDTSIMYDNTQRKHDQGQVQTPYYRNHQQSLSQTQQHSLSQDRYHYQQTNNPQYYSNYQQPSMPLRYNINNSEYTDYVPISSNADPNLQFPTSSSYMSLPSSSSFSSNQQIQQSNSSNSLANNLLSTPLQPTRRLSFTANFMSSVNIANNRSPLTSSATPARTSMVTPKVTTFTHRRSKSRLNADMSPANSGNPFYNPPSFISPKITKKTHRKNISISNSINSISLSHLDTDLNLQSQLGRNVSPNETPLRTPGRYMYGNTVIYGEDYEDEDENENDLVKNHEDLDERMLGHKYMKANEDSPNNTFVVPNVLMNNRFGGELIDTTATETVTGEAQSSILDPVTVNEMNFLDDIFGDTAAVESLNDQMMFQFPSQSLEKSNSYFDTLEQLEQKQKFQPYDSEIQQPGLEPDNDVALSYLDNLNFNKSASVPQTRLNSVSVDAKIQRSRSSFNLSSIASSRDLKNQEQYNSQKPEKLEPHLEASESFNMEENNESISHATSSSSSSSLSSGGGLAKSGSLQEIAERGTSAPSTSNRKTTVTGVKTRSKSKSQTAALPNIQHPEKLDLPQQSARSKSRTKKSGNEDKKVHECPLCHMKFQRPEHVKRHMLSHSSEKPFACPEPGCNKRFNRNDNLKQHLRNIHKKKI
ncbi:hypothetical protein CANINC_004899 [Pichia inconspicua]|uniref:C2H2-type domain-containing protein n=1 Tax=Pichia inconspicua TaxID=52247 RepID=A0A4T0WUQ4_9ASCO|nr:hypothetical protein CANINC_004899 [[Candida] inconspicua]